MNYEERKTLEKRLREIEKEKSEILKKLELATKEANARSQMRTEIAVLDTGTLMLNTFPSSPYSLQGKVVNNTIELIKKLGREVSSTEILQNLKEKNISLGKNEPMTLAAVLGQEVTKKSARLVRVARGLYNLKTVETEPVVLPK